MTGGGRSLHLSGQPRGSARLPPRFFHCASLSSRPLGADVQILPGTLLVRLPGTGVAYASALGRECLNDERSPRYQEGRESPFNRVSLVQQSHLLPARLFLHGWLKPLLNAPVIGVIRRQDHDRNPPQAIA